jgi:hypothetical protein
MAMGRLVWFRNIDQSAWKARVGSVALNGTVMKIFNPAVMGAKDALVKALNAPAFEGLETSQQISNLERPLTY